MKRLTKIILTLAYLVGLIYVATLISPDFFLWITINVAPYEQQTIFFAAITYPAIIFLIFRLWSYKNIDQSTKGSWTFLLLFFGIITIPYYVWKKDYDLLQSNQEITLHNTI